MIFGVSEGYVVEQELVGVGYRAKAQGQNLELSLGYSHPIIFQLPQEVKLTATTEKGKNPHIKLESFDKQLIGQVAAKIRSFSSNFFAEVQITVKKMVNFKKRSSNTISH